MDLSDAEDEDNESSLLQLMNDFVDSACGNVSVRCAMTPSMCHLLSYVDGGSGGAADIATTTSWQWRPCDTEGCDDDLVERVACFGGELAYLLCFGEAEEIAGDRCLPPVEEKLAEPSLPKQILEIQRTFIHFSQDSTTVSTPIPCRRASSEPPVVRAEGRHLTMDELDDDERHGPEAESPERLGPLVPEPQESVHPKVAFSDLLDDENAMGALAMHAMISDWMALAALCRAAPVVKRYHMSVPSYKEASIHVRSGDVFQEHMENESTDMRHAPLPQLRLAVDSAAGLPTPPMSSHGAPLQVISEEEEVTISPFEKEVALGALATIRNFAADMEISGMSKEGINLGLDSIASQLASFGESFGAKERAVSLLAMPARRSVPRRS